MKFFLLGIVLLSQIACTRLQTINLKPHYYSERPNHVIWIQIAGLTDQHLPLLRFNNPDTDYRTQFEMSDCIGKMWAYNLFDIRPMASQSFLAQMTSSKNIKASCDDYLKKPTWSYFAEEGYKTSILENGATNDESLEKFLVCGNPKHTDMKNTLMVRMGPDSTSGVGSFHYEDREDLQGGLYYDKSCQKGLCYSSFFNNAKKILNNLGSTNNRTFYILRDFTYLKALRKKDISRAKEFLQEVDKLLVWVESQKRLDTLVLITGAEGLELDFPKEGKEWSDFERSAKNLVVRNSTLLSTAFARGPMAENFCGLFDETEISKRLLYKPEGKKFSWDVLNPFGF